MKTNKEIALGIVDRLSDLSIKERIILYQAIEVAATPDTVEEKVIEVETIKGILYDKPSGINKIELPTIEEQVEILTNNYERISKYWEDGIDEPQTIRNINAEGYYICKPSGINTNGVSQHPVDKEHQRHILDGNLAWDVSSKKKTVKETIDNLIEDGFYLANIPLK